MIDTRMIVSLASPDTKILSTKDADIAESYIEFKGLIPDNATGWEIDGSNLHSTMAFAKAEEVSGGATDTTGVNIKSAEGSLPLFLTADFGQMDTAFNNQDTLNIPRLEASANGVDMNATDSFEMNNNVLEFGGAGTGTSGIIQEKGGDALHIDSKGNNLILNPSGQSVFMKGSSFDLRGNTLDVRDGYINDSTASDIKFGDPIVLGGNQIELGGGGTGTSGTIIEDGGDAMKIDSAGNVLRLNPSSSSKIWMESDIDAKDKDLSNVNYTGYSTGTNGQKTCDNTAEGEITYNGSHHVGCDGTSWNKLY